MKSKKIDIGSKDIISNLPEPLICQILSFLPTKESALTSLLSKKWRYLFALAPSLEFDDSVYLPKANRRRDETLSMVTDFVDRVLDVRGNSTINKFTLKCKSEVDSVCFIRWILNVLERSVSDLDLGVSMGGPNVLPSKIFVSKSLVRLRIESKKICEFCAVDVGDVYLPKLKTLYLDSVVLGKTDDGFPKLLSGCHVLEELVLINVYNNIWKRPVSSKTLKRLRLHHSEFDQNPMSVSFDTPNLVYLQYSANVAGKYPILNFGSLVEANLHVNVKLRYEKCGNASNGDLVANAADFLMGICNVQILHLSAKTLEVLTYCCEPRPVFNNLIHLTIKTRWSRSWESSLSGWELFSGWVSLPALLRNCPNLETLVFEGLNPKYTIKCGDVDGCLSKSSEDIPTCLSSSPVKVLKILKFGFCVDDDGMEKQMELVKHFLETMPKLEQMILYYDTPRDEDVIHVFKQLQMLPRVASANCKIQVISNNLSLSSSLSTSGLIFFNGTFPV